MRDRSKLKPSGNVKDGVLIAPSKPVQPVQIPAQTPADPEQEKQEPEQADKPDQTTTQPESDPMLARFMKAAEGPQPEASS
ncbi:hypothetical protein QT397_02215 (plasmid) [Microbulbifer sp. MKSA007]|nr:hypothetical protein QT397_02215 [Microbulbifer sp. MKSA007]